MSYYPKTFLFIPAYKDKFLNSKEIYQADCLILDIEDSVPASEKDNAREKAADFIRNKSQQANIKLAVRINGMRSLEGVRDLGWLLENDLPIDYLMPSKVRCAGELKIMKDMTSTLSKKIHFIPLIENAEALENIYSITNILEKGDGLSFGSADLAADLGVDITWETMLYARQKISLCANSAGLMSIDAPFFDLHASLDVLRKETERVKRFGFTSKMCVTPKQIPIIKDVYTSNQQELQKARDVIEQSESHKGKIFVGNDTMIGPPFVRKARRLVSLANHGGGLQ